MKGLLLVLSAPSGAGKSTIIGRLMAAEPGMAFSVSHTTRPPRAGEVDGVDYHFVTEDRFGEILAADGFAEWAHVHGRRYGTSLAEVRRLQDTGRDVVFDVDYQGARQLMRRFPDAVSVFVLPPSLAEVKRRLEARGTDDGQTIALRVANARVELATAGEYRYAVTNDDLDRAVADVQAILRSERNRATRQADRVRSLVAEEV
jgi:guanylate kinase